MKNSRTDKKNPTVWFGDFRRDPGRGSDVSRRHEGLAADTPSSRVCYSTRVWPFVLLGGGIGLFIWAVFVALALWLVGCSSYTRAEYLNMDGDVYQYAQIINGTRMDLGNGFELDLGMGEYFSMDGTKPREVISVGGSFDYGRLSIYAATDVIGPWDVNPEVSLYTSMELTY